MIRRAEKACSAPPGVRQRIEKPSRLPPDCGGPGFQAVHSGGNQFHQPAVKAAAVEIQIKSLVVPHQHGGKVVGPHREDLRIYQHIPGKGQVKARKRSLCVGGKQPAAGLLKAAGSIALGSISSTDSFPARSLARCFRPARPR